MSNKITEEMIEKMVKLYNYGKGLSAQKIGEEFKVSESSVLNKLSEKFIIKRENKENLLGKVFGKLKVIEAAKNKNGRTAWLCQCECGNLKICTSSYLKNDNDKKTCRKCPKPKAERNRKHKRSPKEASFHSVWRRKYHYVAKGDMITFIEFMVLCQQNCHYCGCAPSNYYNCVTSQKKKSLNRILNGYIWYNGLDRKNNLLGHTLENCVPCCKNCNYAKRDRTYDEYREWIQKSFEYWAKA